MIVTDYQLQKISLGFRRPWRTAAAEFRVREGWLLTLRAGDCVGVGECTPLVEFGGPEDVASAQQALKAACAWLMEQSVPEPVAALERWLDECEALHERPASRHAVECALLDLIAQAEGVPLRRILGEQPRTTVPVNALLTAQSAAELATEGRAALAAGFTTVKVKVGVGPLELDVERLGALRAAVGPDLRIRVDANGAWSANEAMMHLRALAPVGLELCEQPVPAADLDALEAVRRAGICPIAADEALVTGGLMLPTTKADVLVLRPMVLGGLLRTVRLGWEAQRSGLRVFVASSLEGPVGRAAAAHAAAALPDCGLAHGLATGALFLDEPPSWLTPVRGEIRFDDGGGLGSEEGRAA
ncbi:MAG: o-succinylbenzoate synthase [Myxococcaceae bacterium]|nr:o-succinylbenzoate synthase [Myxococcaceae bacterium]